jgi:hypothetical protein
MLRDEMRTVTKVILLACVLWATACATNNDNAHTTATTIVAPPVHQQLQISTRPAPKLVAADSGTPRLVFNLADGKTFRPNDEVVIDFSLANATLKGDGGDYRVRYIVDDEEMRWIDKWEQVVLTNWIPGKHTIRLELIGPNGWPVNQGVSVRELTIVK